jgi:FkbM family methyltransferase
MSKNQEVNMANNQPRCGSSDKRNRAWESNYSPKKFFAEFVHSECPVVFDVGAHRGESIEFFSNLFANCEIFSFEPDPENFEILKASAKLASTKAFQLAISDVVGQAEFYQQEISHLGGLAPVNSNSKDSLGFAAKAPNVAISVPVTTIDSFCAENEIPAINVLKVDVQGLESQVLSGARQTLAKTDAVMVEISLYDFYKSSTNSMYEVTKIMHETGFSLWDISNLSKNPENFRTDWLEAVFVRNR